VLENDDADAIKRVRKITNGGVDHVMECVGTTSSMDLAIDICRPGGTIGYVGAPYSMIDDAFDI
jgi:alcohol dehydrogenase